MKHTPELAPDPPKLSAAIRAGAARRSQAFGDYVMPVDGTLGTCVLGAAIEALTGRLPVPLTWCPRGRPPRQRQTSLIALLGLTDAPQLPAPLLCCDWFRSTDAIALARHLNDEHRWTREAIAELLERFGL